MKAIDCAKCRKRIKEETEKEYLKHQYAWFKDSAESFATFSTVAALAVMYRRGRSPKYIKQFYEDLLLIYDYPVIRGKKPVTMLDLMKLFEKEYGLDFKRIKVHLESEKDFIRGVTKGRG